MLAVSTECLASRVSRFRSHHERGEWASCHAILSGLRRCAERQGCAERDTCVCVAKALCGDLRNMLNGQGDSGAVSVADPCAEHWS